MKFILFINVKMPTIIGILALMNRLNTISDSCKAEGSLFFSILYEQFYAGTTQLSVEFILLINVKMPTTVDILAFMSRINTTSNSVKQLKCFQHYHEQWKFHVTGP